MNRGTKRLLIFAVIGAVLYFFWKPIKAKATELLAKIKNSTSGTPPATT